MDFKNRVKDYTWQPVYRALLIGCIKSVSEAVGVKNEVEELTTPKIFNPCRAVTAVLGRPVAIRVGGSPFPVTGTDQETLRLNVVQS